MANLREENFIDITRACFPAHHTLKHGRSSISGNLIECFPFVIKNTETMLHGLLFFDTVDKKRLLSHTIQLQTISSNGSSKHAI